MEGAPEMPRQSVGPELDAPVQETRLSGHAEQMRGAFDSVQRRLAEIKTERREAIEGGSDTYEMNGRKFEIRTLPDAVIAEASEALVEMAELRDMIDSGTNEYQKSIAHTLFEMTRLNYESAKIALRFMEGGEGLLEESGIGKDLIESGNERLEKATRAREDRTLH